jgi:hypothetical protein
MNIPAATTPALVLASTRALLAGLCLFVGLKWMGKDAFLAAAWYAIPALFVALGQRWALWLTLAMNGITVALGLLVLPDFGRLHGGEIFAYASVPAILEILLAIHMIRVRAKPCNSNNKHR